MRPPHAKSFTLLHANPGCPPLPGNKDDQNELEELVCDSVPAQSYSSGGSTTCGEGSQENSVSDEEQSGSARGGPAAAPRTSGATSSSSEGAAPDDMVPADDEDLDLEQGAARRPPPGTGAPRPPHKRARICFKCSYIKPERAHHCSVCRRCVLKMDHHCPWVNNCVGSHNYHYFVLFLFYLWTGTLWYCCTAAHFFGWRAMWGNAGNEFPEKGVDFVGMG